MKTCHRFKDSMKVGRRGEVLFEEWAERQGFVAHKLSVADQKEGGFDYYIEKGESLFAVEVKMDARCEETGRLFLEMKCGDGLGWVPKLIEKPCDGEGVDIWVAWVFPWKNELLFVMAPRLAEVDFTGLQRHMIWNPGYMAEGYAVPVERLAEKGVSVPLE